MLDENTLVNAPAADGNFSFGREGNSVSVITYHHTDSTDAQSAINRFQTSGVQVSAHFIVASDNVYCCVNTDDTAYSNGVWQSNLESVSIEHVGIWLNGFRDDGVIANSARLTAWLRSLYPAATPIRHRDVYPTACPGELPVEEIWQRASDILSPPPVVVPTVAPVKITDIADKVVTTVGNVDLVNLNDGSVIKTIPDATDVTVSATAIYNGESYYLTVYSYSKGINNGLKVSGFKDYVAPAPVQPVVPPTVIAPADPQEVPIVIPVVAPIVPITEVPTPTPPQPGEVVPPVNIWTPSPAVEVRTFWSIIKAIFRVIFKKG